MDLGIKTVIRETLDSSLHMTKDLLMTLDYQETDAIRAVDMFEEHDAALLIRQHAIHHDEQALVQSTVEAREELRRLFDADHQDKT
jgi:glutathione-regulated potassium-efflux system protein KefB